MKGVKKSSQFDPEKPYPEHAWCFGPNEQYCATSRGQQRLHKSDWIIEFDNGELMVVSDELYKSHFANGRKKK